MNFFSIFIHRHKGTTLLAIGLSIAGLLAFNLLPVAPLLQIDFPTISVQAQLPGASPQVMATSVATTLERQIGLIAGITQLTSTSKLGQSSIIVQFDLSRDINGAARDIQAAINASRSELPTTLTNNPSYRKANPAGAPIMILSLTSDHYSQGKLYDIASTILQQKILRSEGIGQVNVGGSSLPAVRIEINPTILNQYGIGLPELASTIAGDNINQAVGPVGLNGQLLEAAEYAPLIVHYQNNQAVRLSDVAQVSNSVADVHNAGMANGKPAVLLVLFKQPGANVIKAVDRIKALMPQFQAMIPSGIHLDILMDRTGSIRTSLHDVELTLLISMILVILVTYLYLGSFRAMLVPGIAVPLSLLGTFAVMKLLNYSLDNLSLMALTISTGFVVDDAVVVLENISRHIALGRNPLQAALEGTREIGFTVFCMSVSLIAVFIPILCMGGIVGRLFREFVIVLSVAIIISMIISLTLTPMMCSRLLHEKEEGDNFFTRINERIRMHYAGCIRALRQYAVTYLCRHIFNVLFNGHHPQRFFSAAKFR